MIKPAAVALMVFVIAPGSSACGSFQGDCSGAAPDGAGNCIPADHGPQAAQEAAFRHFGDQADQVLCFNRSPFRYQGKRFHAYGCKAIRGGHLQNDEIYCVVLRHGDPLTDGEVAALPTQKTKCD